MFGFEYPKHMPVGRVCLEVSLKPFGLDMSDEGIEKTCRELFDEWRELIGHADSVAVLMWTSDGSEILEYNGDSARSEKLKQLAPEQHKKPLCITPGEN